MFHSEQEHVIDIQGHSDARKCNANKVTKTVLNTGYFSIYTDFGHTNLSIPKFNLK